MQESTWIPACFAKLVLNLSLFIPKSFKIAKLRYLTKLLLSNCAKYIFDFCATIFKQFRFLSSTLMALLSWANNPIFIPDSFKNYANYVKYFSIYALPFPNNFGFCPAILKELPMPSRLPPLLIKSSLINYTILRYLCAFNISEKKCLSSFCLAKKKFFVRGCQPSFPSLYTINNNRFEKSRIYALLYFQFLSCIP